MMIPKLELEFNTSPHVKQLKCLIDGLISLSYYIEIMAQKIWSNSIQMDDPRDYLCSFCGNQVGSNHCFISSPKDADRPNSYVYICPRCYAPTYFDEDNRQFPSSAFGEHIEEIPDVKEIIDLYDEARRAMSVDSHTAAAMCCRKLLMNIAVKKGAKKNESYYYYVLYFLDNNYLHEDYKGWVEFIKNKGNEANHEIPEISRGDAEKMITFVGMLIKILYEFNAKMSEASDSSPSS